MPMDKVGYPEARDRMRVGDIIAFSGDDSLPRLVDPKLVVTHAGIILKGKGPGGEDPRFVESTVRLTGDSPTFFVMISSFKERHDEYRGKVWWLPLRDEVRLRFNEAAFANYIQSVKGRPFDVLEGLKVTIKEWLEKLRGEDMLDVELRAAALFCSELVAEALDSAEVVKVDDPSDVSPSDLCSWSLYGETYCQLKGSREEIPRYNSRTPGTT